MCVKLIEHNVLNYAFEGTVRALYKFLLNLHNARSIHFENHNDYYDLLADKVFAVIGRKYEPNVRCADNLCYGCKYNTGCITAINDLVYYSKIIILGHFQYYINGITDDIFGATNNAEDCLPNECDFIISDNNNNIVSLDGDIISQIVQTPFFLKLTTHRIKRSAITRFAE